MAVAEIWMAQKNMIEVNGFFGQIKKRKEK
jgi:hypothetical protein